MKPFFLILSVVVFGMNPRRPGAADEPRHHSRGTNTVAITSALIDSFMEEVRTNSPSLRAANSRASAAEANLGSVRTWEDPVFLFGGSVFSSSGFDPAQQGDLAYGIEQKLPLWNTPKLNRRSAEAALSVRRAEMDYRVEELRRDITKTLLAAALAERLVEIGEEDQAWLEITARAVESKYRTGEAVVADTLQVQNELAERRDRLRTDHLKADHSLLSLNRLLNRQFTTSWPSFQLPAVAPPVPYSAKLVSAALQSEPKLKVMAQEIKQAEATATLARQSRLPEVSLGIEGRQYSRDGGFREGDFTVRFSLPWGNSGKYRKDYEREKEKQKSAEQEREDQELTVREELHHITVDLDAARREALIYTGEISVRALQALSSRLADWESGRGTLRDVMDARRSALEAQLMAVRATAEQGGMLADLLLLAGLPNLEALAPLENEPAIVSHDESEKK